MIETTGCVGCGACVVICPHNCITIEISSEGFFLPKLESQNCTKCGLCKDVCSIYNNDYQHGTIRSYVYTSQNKDVIESVSSGGFAYDFGKAALNHGYKGCGVIYDTDNDTCKHIVYDAVDGLELTKGSKYIPSYTVEAFSKVFANNGKYIVFGTPCQISSVRNVINKKNIADNYILVDFFCHGVPSYNMWFKYLEHIKTTSNIDKINKIHFRCKHYGWHDFTISYLYDGDTYYSDLRLNNDLFYKFFLSDSCLNDCCYSCKYKMFNSCADIRMGDCWSNKFSANKHGVSAICTFTNKGEEALHSFKLQGSLSVEDASIVVEGQMINSPCRDSRSKKVGALLLSDMPLIDISNQCFGDNRIDSIKKNLKKIAKCILRRGK